MMPIKLAFAGTGFNKIHAAAAIQAGAELIAVVNHKTDSMEKFAAEFHIQRQYSNIADLLHDGGVDAMVVCTPNYLHCEQTLAALEAGLHVMVEKPMAMNADEARQMADAGQRTGKALMVAHCFRFDPEVMWIREQVAAGRIGRVIRTKGSGVHVNWGPGGWFTQKKFAGGGAMADMGVHALDTVRYLLGDPQPLNVFAKISTEYGSYDVDDTGIVMIEWDNGTNTYFECGWRQTHADQPNAGTQLYGEAGFASVFPTRIETPNNNLDGIDIDTGGFLEERPETLSLQKYQNQMSYFLQCINEGLEPSPGGSHGYGNMRIIDAAYESSKTGKVVSLS